MTKEMCPNNILVRPIAKEFQNNVQKMYAYLPLL